MAEIRPFRGTFYNPRVVEDLSRVLAPPYDVIDERRKGYLLSRSPYNIVRLILPRSDSDREFWNNSAALFRAWKKGDVLTTDAGPCLYVYRQTFNIPASEPSSRLGILAVLRCKDLSSGEILPHEKTFSHTRTERLNLLRACRANFSQVFTVFRDPEEEVLALLEEASTGPVFLAFNDEEGVEHELWRIEDPTAVGRLVGMVGERKLIIADGHHRYETALVYGSEDPRAENTDPARRYVSATLFRSEDPGLVVLPVHRLLRRLPLSVEEAYERIGRYFHVEIVQHDLGARQGMFREKLEGSGRPGFIMITSGGAALLLLREEIDPARILKGPESKRWKRLDISILHSLIIGESLGLDADRLAEEGDLCFTPWESEALSGVLEGEAEAAFLIRPTPIQDIWEIAEGGERMPHKSSYFYPKLPSGLVIYDHETAFS